MYEFIDLFCGAGGFSTGLELAGFRCIGGIDNIETIVKTHALNHKHSKSICGDIREVPPEKFAKIIGKKRLMSLSEGLLARLFQPLETQKFVLLRVCQQKRILEISCF